MTNLKDNSQCETVIDTLALIQETEQPEPHAPNPVQSCLVQIYPADFVAGMILLESEFVTIGRDQDCDLVLPDANVSRLHVRLARTASGFVLQDLGSTNGSLVNGHAVKEVELISGDTIQVGTYLFRFLSADSVETQYHETVYSAATRDALTGTFNRRFLMDSMQREFSRTLRSQSPLSIIMTDIDFFKQINDRYGHLSGDEVLREFGKRIRSNCREEDIVARLGGEEFCIVLSDTDFEGAEAVAEQCRQVVANQPFETTTAIMEVTASFGIATLDLASPISVEALIDQADQHLYLAKNAGRNRVGN